MLHAYRQAFFGWTFAFFCIPCAFAKEVDLRQTKYADELLLKLISNTSVRLGNEGRSEWTKLSFDPDTHQITGHFMVIAKHSWGKIKWKDYFSIPPVTNTEDISVGASAKAEFIYDVETRKVAAGIKVPIGERSITILGKKYRWNFGEVGISADHIKRAMDGDLTALVETLPTLGLFSTKPEDDYVDMLPKLEAEYGQGNVYLASKDFVDKCAPSKGFNYAVSMIATAGASFEATMQALGELAKDEVVSLGNWLIERGISEGQQIATSILVDQEAVRIPQYYMAIKWAHIEYRNRAVLIETTVTPWVREKHGAFYVVLKRKEENSPPKIDANGFDVGSLGKEDFPDSKIPAVPDGAQSASVGIGIPASESRRQFEIDVVNSSDKKLNIAIVKGAELMAAYTETIRAGGSDHTHAHGASERLLGVWETDTGQLVVLAPIVINQDLKITIGRSGDVGDYWYGAVPR